MSTSTHTTATPASLAKATSIPATSTHEPSTHTTSTIATDDGQHGAASPTALFTRRFVLLAVCDLAYFTAAGVAIFTLPLYVTGPVGSNTSGVGLVFGAFAISALVLRPVAGRLTDRLGRRPLLLAGALIAAVGLLLMSQTTNLAGLVAIRLLLGVAEAAFFVATFAALVDLAPPARLGEALSYNSLGLYLGLALGPPLGEVLVSRAGFVAAWSGATVLAFLAALAALALGETHARAPRHGPPQPLIHWRSVPISLGFLASVIAMGGFLAFAALQADAVGLGSPSAPLFAYGAVVVVCRIAFAKVVDRLPSLVLGAAALGAIALGLVVVATWHTPPGLMVGTLVLGLGVSFSTPALFSAIFAQAGPDERGAASGTASVFLDLGLGGGPIVLGVVAQSVGFTAAFGAAAGCALAGGAWVLGLHARRR